MLRSFLKGDDKSGGKTVPAEMHLSCCHDDGQELVSSLIYCLKIGRKNHQK